MKIEGKVHCLFEQSGTFRDEFRKMGFEAFDYDINDELGKTDFRIDLFSEIEAAWEGKPSVFDGFNPEDFLMAFFPCVYFCHYSQLEFLGANSRWTHCNTPMDRRLATIVGRERKRSLYYTRLLQLCWICERKNLRMVVENPRSATHYLDKNFPNQYAPYIDKDRSRRGDRFRKPTQFFQVNCKLSDGFTLDPYQGEIMQVNDAKKSGKAGECSLERSTMTSTYARHFIEDKILGLTEPSDARTDFFQQPGDRHRPARGSRGIRRRHPWCLCRGAAVPSTHRERGHAGPRRRRPVRQSFRRE